MNILNKKNGESEMGGFCLVMDVFLLFVKPKILLTIMDGECISNVVEFAEGGSPTNWATLFN